MSEHDLRADYAEDGPSFEAQVKGPAVALWLCGCATAFFGLIAFVVSTVGFVRAFVLVPREPREESADFCIAMGWTGMIFVWGTLMLRGASQMWDGRQYRLAVIAAVLAIAPLPCVVAGIVSLPVGVWALMVLLRPDVRARFEAVARIGLDNSISTNLPTGK